jgi:hypothetical protein
MEKTGVSWLRTLAGPEIETLPDYLGQGALAVHYLNPTTEKPVFHPLKDAYNDIIAQADGNGLCMSTDSNRSEGSEHFPKRTSIEFRSGPEQGNTEELLQLTKAYSDWVILQKDFIKKTAFKNYKNPTRRELNNTYYINLSNFITYYNELASTTIRLQLTSPKDIFDPKKSRSDFEFCFPDDAEWVLLFDYEDLAPKIPMVFTTQYNLSLPIGCIFAPQVRNAFPIAHEFSLINKEKEIAPDFNESRPHVGLRQYEQMVFASSVKLAATFFAKEGFPTDAIGAQDFLRGMAYEIALTSTSRAYLAKLFQYDALWIAEQHRKVMLERGEKAQDLSEEELHDIALSLADTLRKSLFPYFMKATLADFFKQLHPYEQHLLRSISKKGIQQFCLKALELANDGVGVTEEHPSHFVLKNDSFMDIFDDFYEQTFQGVPVAEDQAPADPIGFLTDRFIKSENLGSTGAPLPALVVELRIPAQGKQKYADIQAMCANFSNTHQTLLAEFYPVRQTSNANLDALYEASRAPKPKSSSRRARASMFQMVEATAVPADDVIVASKRPLKRKASEASLQECLSDVGIFSPKRTRVALRSDSKHVKPMELSGS